MSFTTPNRTSSRQSAVLQTDAKQAPVRSPRGQFDDAKDEATDKNTARRSVRKLSQAKKKVLAWVLTSRRSLFHDARSLMGSQPKMQCPCAKLQLCFQVVFRAIHRTNLKHRVCQVFIQAGYEHRKMREALDMGKLPTMMQGETDASEAQEPNPKEKCSIKLAGNVRALMASDAWLDRTRERTQAAIEHQTMVTYITSLMERLQGTLGVNLGEFTQVQNRIEVLLAVARALEAKLCRNPVQRQQQREMDLRGHEAFLVAAVAAASKAQHTLRNLAEDEQERAHEEEARCRMAWEELLSRLFQEDEDQAVKAIKVAQEQKAEANSRLLSVRQGATDAVLVPARCQQWADSVPTTRRKTETMESLSTRYSDTMESDSASDDFSCVSRVATLESVFSFCVATVSDSSATGRISSTDHHEGSDMQEASELEKIRGKAQQSLLAGFGNGSLEALLAKACVLAESDNGCLDSPTQVPAASREIVSSRTQRAHQLDELPRGSEASCVAGRPNRRYLQATGMASLEQPECVSPAVDEGHTAVSKLLHLDEANAGNLDITAPLSAAVVALSTTAGAEGSTVLSKLSHHGVDSLGDGQIRAGSRNRGIEVPGVSELGLNTAGCSLDPRCGTLAARASTMPEIRSQQQISKGFPNTLRWASEGRALEAITPAETMNSVDLTHRTFSKPSSARMTMESFRSNPAIGQDDGVRAAPFHSRQFCFNGCQTPISQVALTTHRLLGKPASGRRSMEIRRGSAMEAVRGRGRNSFLSSPACVQHPPVSVCALSTKTNCDSNVAAAATTQQALTTTQAVEELTVLPSPRRRSTDGIQSSLKGLEQRGVDKSSPRKSSKRVPSKHANTTDFDGEQGTLGQRRSSKRSPWRTGKVATDGPVMQWNSAGQCLVQPEVPGNRRSSKNATGAIVTARGQANLVQYLAERGGTPPLSSGWSHSH